MGLQERFDRILRSLHEAAFDDAVWPATAGLIDDACGLKGNHLVFGGGSVQWDTRIYFARFCLRGQRRRDLEQWYFREYWFRDERVPRVRELADGVLVPIRELYTEAERKTSATYNEALPAGFNQDGLNVRLAAPGGTRVAWALGDPVEPGGRRPDQVRMIEQLLPHVRHFVSVRTALAEARALGKSFADLLDATQVGVIHLDPRGRIAAANDRAVEVLRQRAGLLDDDGALHAVEPADDAELQRLLRRAMPLLVEEGAGGSMTVGRRPPSPRLVLHVSPVELEMDARPPRVAALVLVVEPDRQPVIDADLVASALDLTPSQSSMAVMLARGCSLREIAEATHRKEVTVRWHLKQAFSKLRIARQSDLVRLVLSVSPGSPSSRRSGGPPVPGPGDEVP